MNARMNAMVYNGCKSLRTTDNCLQDLLLRKHRNDGCRPLQSDVIKIQGRSVLATIKSSLAPRQCEEIIENCKKKRQFGSMLDKYKASERNNSRMLILDKNFAVDLWKVFESAVSKIFREHDLPFQPLGFDVERGEWQMYGLNEAFRINKYDAKKQEFFSIHRDAQYCPNGDRRSLLTLLVYLNDDFKGGETAFYFQKCNEAGEINPLIGKDMTAKEEIERLGGLEMGYESFIIEPSVGKAVVFSHNILHESLPVTKNAKYVLKTDIVVKRADKSYGFAVNEQERSDYLQCLNHFREAQNQELIGNKEKAGKLYERALSIRYCYPMAKESGQDLNSSQISNDYVHGDNYLLPSSVWQNIFSFLNGKDIENVLKVFPGLYRTQKAWEMGRFRADIKDSAKESPYIPVVDSQHGICTQFRFKDAFFFSENEEACIRVTAMYAFYLLGHRADDQFYTVKYNPETQDVFAVALKSLLTDTFLNRPCFGSVYAVSQQDPSRKDVQKDFLGSVDSSYMTLRHGAQFLGGAIGEKMQAKVKWSGVSEQMIEKYIKDDIEIDDSCQESLPSEDENEIDSKQLKGTVETSEESDDDDANSDDTNINDRTDNFMEEKILEVSKDNILFGDYSMNEFIFFYDTSEESLSSVPVVIKDVIVYKSLETFLSEFSVSAEWFEKYLHENAPTHHTSYTDEIQHDFSNAKSLYLKKMIEISKKKPGVSAAIVTSIPKNTEITEHMCFCYWPGGEGYDKIYQLNQPKCYNHLVFDFSSHQMNVTKSNVSITDGRRNTESNNQSSKVNESFHCKDGCIFTREFYDAFCEKKMTSEFSDLLTYKVDISPILEGANGFNHASCNCSVPAFEFEECHNIQDYPALDHIHIVGGVDLKSNQVILWTFYGGIVAL